MTDTASAVRPAARARPATSAPRVAHPVLERLFELYPKLFGARFLPLKLGVYQEILALHPDEFRKEDLKLAMGQHARSTRYLESVAAGNMRHDLNGEPVQAVATEHVLHAIGEVFRRRQARSREDLRPWLRARLAAAVTVSGLTRADFCERYPVQDETLAAALDEAFGEMAERHARREALQKAFEASATTVEAFAEMYGMDVATVRQALNPAMA